VAADFYPHSLSTPTIPAQNLMTTFTLALLTLVYVMLLHNFHRRSCPSLFRK
jgi:hypothetical protein